METIMAGALPGMHRILYPQNRVAKSHQRLGAATIAALHALLSLPMSRAN